MWEILRVYTHRPPATYRLSASSPFALPHVIIAGMDPQNTPEVPYQSSLHVCVVVLIRDITLERWSRDGRAVGNPGHSNRRIIELAGKAKLQAQWRLNPGSRQVTPFFSFPPPQLHSAPKA